MCRIRVCLLTEIIVHILHLIQNRSKSHTRIIPRCNGIYHPACVVDRRKPPGIPDRIRAEPQQAVVNLATKSVTVVSVLTAALIDDARLLSLVVVVVGHRTDFRFLPRSCHLFVFPRQLLALLFSNHFDTTSFIQ